MAEITASMVKDLRDRTGAAMMLCKEALKESDGAIEEAIVYIRKKLGAKLSDRGERVTAEGVVAVAVVDERDGAIVELNSETDFVARNEEFKNLANELAVQIAKSRVGSVEELMQLQSLTETAMTVQERIHDVFSRLRESIVFRRFSFVSTGPNGSLAAYVHMPSNDKIGVLVELETDSPEAAASESIHTLGKEIAMQVAASRPRYLTREEVPERVLDQERDIARVTARNEGKPDAAVEKIIEGRVRKFYEETVLLDQPYLRDPKRTVAKLIQQAGSGVKLRRFIRYEVGEQDGGASASGAIKESVE